MAHMGLGHGKRRFNPHGFVILHLSPTWRVRGELVSSLIMGIFGVQGDLVGRLIMGMIGVSLWLIGVVDLLTKSPLGSA